MCVCTCVLADILLVIVSLRGVVVVCLTVLFLVVPFALPL